MAYARHVTSLHTDYRFIVHDVLTLGYEVSPRGMKTREVRNALMTFDQPDASLPVGCGRELHPAIAVAEALQLISGRSMPDLLVRITPNMRQFTHEEDGCLVMHGAYGPRAHWQMQHVINKLHADPDTRQALVAVWSPALDLAVVDPDIPCTCNLIFALRNGELHLTTTMRSNDVWWGLAYDVFQFTQLQLTLARCLGVSCGTYTHFDASLHVYEKDFDAIKKLHQPAEYEPPRYYGVGNDTGEPWIVYSSRANLLLEGLLPEQPTATETWMHEVLQPYIVKDD